MEISVRAQIIGYRPGNLGAPPGVAAGRPLAASRYEMVIDRKAGIPFGARLPMGRMTFIVVGLTEGIVSSSGDSTAYVSLQDAQELQFLKANETVRNERARLEADLKANPTLAGPSRCVAHFDHPEHEFGQCDSAYGLSRGPSRLTWLGASSAGTITAR